MGAIDQSSVHRRRFLSVVLNQFLSSAASGLTTFGLSVWAFQVTRSATVVAIMALLSQVPRALSMFVTGALVDRLEPRRALLFGNTAAALVLLPASVLVWRGQAEIWHLHVAVVLGAVCLSGQWPAAASSVVSLCEREQYVRANGLLQAGNAASAILSPLLAGAVLARSGLATVLMLGIALHAAAVAVIAPVRIPERAAPPSTSRALFREELWEGLCYLRRDPTLLSLTLVMAGCSFAVSIAMVLLKPLILSFASATAVGTVLSIAGVGMLVGSLGVSLRGYVARTVNGIMALIAVSGACMMAAGLHAKIVLVGAMMFLYSLLQPVVGSAIHTIFQERVPPALLGRLFALTTAITLGVMPLAAPVAGPLADHVFEPLLRADGPLAGSVGVVMGTGPGRGTGLLFVLLGAFIAALAAGGRRRRDT